MEEFYMAQSISVSIRKVNADTSVQLEKWSEVGVVIKDFNSIILAAATWAILPNLETHEVEAWAYYLGLKFAMDCCLMDIVLETDNIEVA